MLGAGRPYTVQFSVTFSDNTFVTTLLLTIENDGGTIKIKLCCD